MWILLGIPDSIMISLVQYAGGNATGCGEEQPHRATVSYSTRDKKQVKYGLQDDCLK